LPGGPHVGDHQPTARTQHPHRFVEAACQPPDIGSLFHLGGTM
jgi:hypothetical protein